MDINLIEDNESATYEKEIQDIDSALWQEAMKSEMDFMYTNQVWTLVDAPEGIKSISCKSVFQRKIYMDGNIQTYKSRLVAKGYRERYGVDYDETFSHVVMIKSIRIMLAIVVYFDYEIWQIDVKTSFLNENLLEDVYM